MLAEAGKTLVAVSKDANTPELEEAGQRVGETIGDDGTVEWRGLLEGIARSNRLGITIMIEDRIMAPVVQVQSGTATEIEWNVYGW